MNEKPRRKVTPTSTATDKAVDLTEPGTSTSPKLPHERDEGVGTTGGVPSARVQQGQLDLKRGVQDTSRAAEADAAYKKLKK